MRNLEIIVASIELLSSPPISSEMASAVYRGLPSNTYLFEGQIQGHIKQLVELVAPDLGAVELKEDQWYNTVSSRD